MFFWLLKAEADIQFTFPVQSSEEEELRLIFNWKSALMSDMAQFDNDDSLYPSAEVASNKDYYHGTCNLLALVHSTEVIYAMLTRRVCAIGLQTSNGGTVDVRTASPPRENATDSAVEQCRQNCGLLSHNPRNGLSGVYNSLSRFNTMLNLKYSYDGWILNIAMMI